MLANANPYAGSIPVNPFAREIAAVCDKHAVGHGSPGKLADFMRALDRNKHLAMDFWSLVVRISSEERGGSVDPDWLLAVIVEGVTGWNVATLRAAGTPETKQVTELAHMLAGEDVHSPVLVHDENSRLVLEAEPPATPETAAPTLRPLENDQPTAFHMAGYAETRSSGIILSRPAIVGLLLVLCAATVLFLLPHQNPSGWARLGDSIRNHYASTISALTLHRETQPASAGPDQNSLAAIPVPGEAEPHPAANYPDWTQPPPSAQVIPVEPLTPARTTPAAAKTAPVAARTAPVAAVAAPASAIAKNNPAPSITSPPAIHFIPTAAGLVVIPEQSMKAHLISSRVPIYSATARAAHATGPVVIKAIVTARGTVEPLQIVAGDPALRHAALDAVSTWRYRPYLVDGIPADVSTTISVDPPNSN
jgi:TonB family protein